MLGVLSLYVSQP